MYKIYNLKDVKEESAKALFTFGDFFAGGGGSSTGLKLAGGKELFINEFVEEACTTFATNYPDVKIFPGDIKQLTPEEILSKVGINKGDLDILSGSPPCSAFSVAGKRDKGWGKEKTYSDGKKVENIEDLFFEYLRMVEGLMPKVVISENVEGMVLGEAAKYVSRVINEFNRIGYEVTYKVMNAAEYGVPQARKRTIFVAVRNDVLDDIGLSFWEVATLIPDTTNDTDVSMKAAIDSIDNDPDEVQMLIDFAAKGYQSKVIPNLPHNPTKHTKPTDKKFKSWNPKGSFFNMIRPCPDLPSPTLTQAGQKRGLSGVLHYNQDRKLTIKEMVRLMSLPEDYNLTGTFDQQAERICRMVAPIMMMHVGKHLYNKVLLPLKEKQNDK